MTYNTLNPLGSKDPRDLYDNATNFDLYSNGPSPMYPNRFGVEKLSIEGMNQAFNSAQAGMAAQFAATLASLGYTWIGDYGAGLNFTTRQQYTVRGGLNYVVDDATTLPFTTTGDWATDQSKLKLITSDQVLRIDLASTDSAKGVALVSGAQRVVDSIAALKASPKTGSQYIFVTGYYSGSLNGGGQYLAMPGDTTTPGNDVTIVVAADGGRWRLNHNGVVSLKQAGCRGDGTTDDTVRAQALIGSGVPVIYVDTVAVGFRFTAPLVVNRSMTITGNNVQPYAEGGPYQSKGAGSWLFFDHMGRGISIVTAVSSGFIATVYLEKIGTYRKHTAAINASWTPTGFDFDIAATNADVFYTDLMLLNPNKAILHLNGLAGRITIDNVRGQFLSQGIYIENTQDSVRVNNLHDWPFWLADTNITNWTTANKILFVLQRCDNPLLSNIFTIYTNTGIAIYSNASGSVSKLKGVNLDFDQTWNWLVIDPAADGVTASFCNVSIFGPLPNTNAQCALIRGTNARVNIVNLHTEAVSNGAVIIEGTGNVVKVLSSHVKTWDRLLSGAAVYNVATGNTLNIADVTTTEGSGTVMFAGAGTIRYPQGVKSGQAVIASGAASVVVTHGLGRAPTVNQIQLTMATGISTAKTVYVSAPTATTFTINTEVAPSASISVNWRAALE